jgi:hypothetical protein
MNFLLGMILGIVLSLFICWFCSPLDSADYEYTNGCNHKFDVVYSTFTNSHYEYFKDEYNFCIKCGEPKVEWVSYYDI